MVVWGHPDYGGNDSRIKWMLTEGVVSPHGFRQSKTCQTCPGLVTSLMQTECSP